MPAKTRTVTFPERMAKQGEMILDLTMAYIDFLRQWAEQSPEFPRDEQTVYDIEFYALANHLGYRIHKLEPRQRALFFKSLRTYINKAAHAHNEAEARTHVGPTTKQ